MSVKLKHTGTAPLLNRSAIPVPMAVLTLVLVDVDIGIGSEDSKCIY